MRAAFAVSHDRVSHLSNTRGPAMPRTPEIVYAELDADPRVQGRGPLKVWLQSAELAERAQALGAFCRFGSSLPPRLSELAIIVTGAFWRAPFEWHAHAPLAIKAGIDPAAVEAIRTGRMPQFAREDEAAVYAFASELTQQRRVSDPTYHRAVDLLGTRAVVELVGILGYYTLISMTIVAFEV